MVDKDFPPLGNVEEQNVKCNCILLWVGVCVWGWRSWCVEMRSDTRQKTCYLEVFQANDRLLLFSYKHYHVVTIIKTHK